MAAPTPALASISSLRSDLEAPPTIRLDEDLEDLPPADDRERLGALVLITLALLPGSSLRVSISAGSAHDIGGESYRFFCRDRAVALARGVLGFWRQQQQQQ